MGDRYDKDATLHSDNKFGDMRYRRCRLRGPFVGSEIDDAVGDVVWLADVTDRVPAIEFAPECLQAFR
jgi:hypothetical protein